MHWVRAVRIFIGLAQIVWGGNTGLVGWKGQVEISQVHSLSGSRLATISEERIKAGTKSSQPWTIFSKNLWPSTRAACFVHFFFSLLLRSIVLVSLACFLAWGLKGIYNFVFSRRSGISSLQLSSLGSQESRGKADESLDTFLVPRLQTDAAGVCVLVQ